MRPQISQQREMRTQTSHRERDGTPNLTPEGNGTSNFTQREMGPQISQRERDGTPNLAPERDGTSNLIPEGNGIPNFTWREKESQISLQREMGPQTSHHREMGPHILQQDLCRCCQSLSQPKRPVLGRAFEQSTAHGWAALNPAEPTQAPAPPTASVAIRQEDKRTHLLQNIDLQK